MTELAHEPQEEVPCPLCGSRDYETAFYARDRLFGRPGRYRIVQCKACEMRYLSPRPTLAALGAHYPEDYFIYRTDDALPAFARPMSRWYSNVRWRESLKRLERAIGRVPADLKVVDVGCGQNDYLAALEKMRGAQGIGVDFKPEVAAYVRDKLHMPVVAGTLQDAKFPDAHFDLVTMNEYLEHEPNPRAVLAEAHRITKPGGHLALEVPYTDSWPARVFGSRWSQVDAPRHLVHFTEKTLAEMLRRSGYELVHTETYQIMYVIGFSALQALGHRRLGRLTFWDRVSVMAATTLFVPVAPFIDEFRFAVARAV